MRKDRQWRWKDRQRKEAKGNEAEAEAQGKAAKENARNGGGSAGDRQRKELRRLSGRTRPAGAVLYPEVVGEGGVDVESPPRL